MKIATILDHIESRHMALPEFQRGYVWNRDQVRALMDSLYRKHPVGTLLVWATQAADAPHRGEGDLAPGVVKLLLDGQQRITSLYGIIRGAPPEFFDGNAQAFTGLRFHLEREEFAFYSPVHMRDDPLWVDVSDLMKRGTGGLGVFVAELGQQPELASRIGDYIGRLSAILAIQDVDLHVEEVTGTEKTIDVVVEIFNRVNSGGTKLSKGDLALAKICAEWPEGRIRMKAALERWRDQGYYFSLDWLLRCVNTMVTGEARFAHLHIVDAGEVAQGLERAERVLDNLLNAVGSRLGLDHDRVLFGRFAFPVMARYVSANGGLLTDGEERDQLLFWYVHSALWGRFSGSTESVIDQDLELIKEHGGGIERLIRQLQLWHGSLHISPEHFAGWSLGARFYPMLYMLSRVGEARDWGNGLVLRQQLLGKMSSLEVHHIFPKARLYKAGYSRPEVNAVANFCLQTKDTNLRISDRSPEEYLPEIQAAHPGTLESQWIPMDPELWRLENYRAFLAERRALLAGAANSFLAELLHGVEVQLVAATGDEEEEPPVVATPAVPGGVDDEEEERALTEVREWLEGEGLPGGEYLYELADANTGAPLAVLDLAWPDGLQEGLSQRAAVLLNEEEETLEAANAHGFRCFTDVGQFRRYVTNEVLVINDRSAAG